MFVMSGVHTFCKWLEQTPLGAGVRQSLWLFPAVETLHLLGMTALLATISILDLRLLGCAKRRTPISELVRRVLPWTWAGFAVQVLTGALLFSSEAVRMLANPAFRMKMFLIGLAGLDALIFHVTARRTMPSWDERRTVPLAARLAGLVSLLIWIGVVAAGRWIGFL